ncbi:MAG: hypothetical protein H7338_17190 [Candidatus Sericytochromatia bacterium]|nr:hypothetical protein [Candidatus Sericytochromatia bacterium]
MKSIATPLLIIALCSAATGCGGSVLTPGLTPRQAVSQKLFEQGRKIDMPQKTQDCIVARINSGLTDAEMARADAKMAAGGVDATASGVLTVAVIKCLINATDR